MTALNIHEVLERAGADASAPEGSQAWALARLEEAAAELIETTAEMLRLAKGPVSGVSLSDKRSIIARVESALAQCGCAR